MKVFLLHRDRDFSPAPGLRDEVFDALVSGNLWALPNVMRNLERSGTSARGRRGPGTTMCWRRISNWTRCGTRWPAATSSCSRPPSGSCYRACATQRRSSTARALADCAEHESTVVELYRIAIEALAYQREVGSLWAGAGPDLILSRSVRLLKLHVRAMRRLRQVADEHADRFRSDGFTRFFATVREELADDYLEAVDGHLRDLEFGRGLLESAQLGTGDRGESYIVHEPPRELRWKERLPLIGNRREPEYSFELHPRDQAGATALAAIRGKGINQVADAVARSADHVQSFFTMLRLELAFYLSCLNLRARLDRKVRRPATRSRSPKTSCHSPPRGSTTSALRSTSTTGRSATTWRRTVSRWT